MRSPYWALPLALVALFAALGLEGLLCETWRCWHCQRVPFHLKVLQQSHICEKGPSLGRMYLLDGELQVNM